MKSGIRILAAGIILLLSALFAQKSEAQQHVSLQVFYDQLSPYGQWLDNPEYGYVWLPEAGPDFVPYGSMGHWIFTDYGWTWVSAYEWGWAPFHYGRWDFDNYYGWFWIPGNEWGPAWVSWRRADGYYGWEPLGPGISVSISFDGRYDRGHDHWIFVRNQDFDRGDINQYYVDRSQNYRIVANSTIINNTYIDNSRNTTYVTGPDRNEIQEETGRRINSVTISDESNPGQTMGGNGSLHIYRPQVAQINRSERRAAPAKYTNLKDVAPISNRTANEAENINQTRRTVPQNHQTSQSRSVEANTQKRSQSSSAAPQNHPVNETNPAKAEQKRQNENQNRSASAQKSDQPVKNIREYKARNTNESAKRGESGKSNSIEK